MTNPADLISRLNNIKLSVAPQETETASNPQDGHVLSLEFPAVDLLPENVHPHIERPANLEHRRQPDPNSLQPDLGSEFFAVLKPQTRRTASLASTHHGCNAVIGAIESLKDIRGSSVLRVVTFKNNADLESLGYRFELRTNLRRPFGDTSSSQQIELNQEASSSLLSYADNEPWIYLLRDLMTRASELAFFEVRARLLNAYPDAALEEYQWESAWYSEPPRCAEQLFWDHLDPASAEDKNAMYAMGDRSFQAEIPCGRLIHVRKVDVVKMTREACLAARCQTCSERVIQRSDQKELLLHEECWRVEEFRARNVVWRKLDKEFWLSVTDVYAFDSRTIVEVLDLALNSFNGPRLICPPSLAPVNLYSPETTMIMQHFGGVYGQRNVEIHISPSDLFESLYGLAMSTETGFGIIAKVRMPPDWDQFLIRWLIRAVTFLIERRCTNNEDGHESLHEHSDGLYYHADAIDEEVSDEAEHERHMRDVETKMKDAAIGNAQQTL